MKDTYAFDAISRESIRQLVTKYPSVVSSTLQDLDNQRYDVIPKLVTLRRLTSGYSYLEMPDLKVLVEWKLKHGTFRPSLLALLASNEPRKVYEATKEASEPVHSGVPSEADVAIALDALTTLKGIGPATASLILSVFLPDQFPFFSDELFRWSEIDSSSFAGTTEGKPHPGWRAKIKYNKKEYVELYKRVQTLRDRLNASDDAADDHVTALDLEKAAYVLARLDEGGKEDALGDIALESAARDSPAADTATKKRKHPSDTAKQPQSKTQSDSKAARTTRSGSRSTSKSK